MAPRLGDGQAPALGEGDMWLRLEEGDGDGPRRFRRCQSVRGWKPGRLEVARAAVGASVALGQGTGVIQSWFQSGKVGWGPANGGVDDGKVGSRPPRSPTARSCSFQEQKIKKDTLWASVSSSVRCGGSCCSRLRVCN